MTAPMVITGYEIDEEPLYLSRSTRILKGVIENAGESEGARQEVIIKTFALTPSVKQNQRLRLEYELTAQFSGEANIIKTLACLEYEHSYALVFEYLPFPSLKAILAEKKKLPLADCLLIGINLAKALQCVHEKNIIHKDINPANILCNLTDKTIKLIDFGSAISLPKEHASIQVNLLEGTLAYMAPEQTGRMNRGLDYRCDYYSLGVSLYQMLTGLLPFKGQDALELIHQHMAVMPKLPHEVNPNIPQVVSDIVMKLMMKTCEERYQSLYGLIFDLEQCREQYREKGQIEAFPIASEDRYHRFQIPEKLYGREAEVNTLMQAYKASISGQASLILIAGYPGIGKTTLVQEIYKPIVRERGYFIRGKFEQFKRYIPFSGLSHAFDSLVEQIIVEEPEVVKHYKDAILAAVANKGQLLLDIIPSFQIIIGPQPPVPPVSSDKAKDRLAHVFYQFFHALNWIEHPLVIFLDDVQWIDDASLNLLSKIMSESAQHYLLFITAYRSNEVDSGHPFIQAVAELKKEGVQVHDIALYPLDILSVQALLADALYRTPKQVYELANICHLKTAGNPFFLNQLLLSLAQEKLIVFNNKNNQWFWDLAKIKASYVSPNVVDLLTKKMHNLQEKTQKLLQYAACIGSYFDLRLLAHLSQTGEEALMPLLEEAQKEGFIEAREDSGWQFAHDRIQQAALSLLPEETQKKAHLELARFLLQSTDNKALDSLIFILLEHYNLGLDLNLEWSEKEKIVRLNLRATKLSKASGAYATALNFMEKALICVDQNLWKTDYPLMLELYVEAAEAAYLSANYEKVDTYSALALKQTQNQVDKLKIMQTQVKMYSAQLKIKPAIHLVRQALLSMGIAFPKKVTLYHVLLALIKAHLGINPQALLSLPEMQNTAYKELALLILPVLALAYRTVPNTYALLVCLTALIYAKQGYSPGIASIYADLAILEIGVFNAIPKGFALYEAAKQLSARQPDEEEQGRVLLHGNLYAHHKVALQANIKELRAAFALSFGCGDFINAFDATNLEIGSSLFTAEPLEEWQNRASYYLTLMKKTKQFHAEAGLLILLATAHKLQIPTEDPCSLSYSDYDETAALKLYQARKERTHMGVAYLVKTILCVIFANYPQAWQLSLHFEGHLQDLPSTFAIPRFYFYQALIALQLMPKASSFNLDYRRRLFRALRKLTGWAKHCPYNYRHMVYLIKAEYASKIKKSPDEARRYYDLAIDNAKKNHFLSDEAIANELAAKHYLAQNWPALARIYLQRASHCYTLWGARAKILQLQTNYPLLFQKEQEIRSMQMESTITEFSMPSFSLELSSNLDIKAILKATRSLPSSLMLKDLLPKLMRILIENIGAEKCALLLEEEGHFFIEAQQHTLEATSSFLQSLALDEDTVPLSVIRFIINSKKPLWLNDAQNVDPYNRDNYILKHQIKSLLCLPLIKKRELYGILYLENNKAEASFSRERFDLLKLLLPQITISIDNARLYHETLELTKANERFVPAQILDILHYDSIADVQLGDSAEEIMTVMFLDIRNFTSLSEKMTPKENFQFVNRFLEEMVPIIHAHQGIIDKYIGNAIMVIFFTADQALKCTLALMKTLAFFNQARKKEEKPAIKISIGINTGKVMIGMLGENGFMNATVISDDVNLASRVGSLSKNYPDTPIIVTQNTVSELKEPDYFMLKKLGTVKVKGKEQAVDIWGIESLGD